MGRKIRTISRVVPSIIEGEPPSEPPYLNPTASWYLGDAWDLFHDIVQRCGLPTAKFLFEQCIKEASRQEELRAKIDREKAARAKRTPIKLPTLKQIDAADHRQICRWWDLLQGQELKSSEKKVIGRLAARYKDFGGYPEGYIEGKLPPIKKKGATRKVRPAAAELPALFTALKIEHPRLSNPRIAEIVVERFGRKYGKNVEAVIRNERNWR
jgi:hypothetical protein